MLRDKLLFFVMSTLRSKSNKQFKIIQNNNEVNKTRINIISKKIVDHSPFEVPLKTKILIFIFAAPLLIRQVYSFPFQKPLSVDYQQYLDINLTSMSCGFTLLVGCLLGKSLLSIGKNKFEGNLAPSIFLKSNRCYWGAIFFLILNTGVRLNESWMFKEYPLIPNFAACVGLSICLKNALNCGYVPFNLFSYIKILYSFLFFLNVWNGISAFNERKKEIKFLTDFGNRILKLQEANLISLIRKI